MRSRVLGFLALLALVSSTTTAQTPAIRQSGSITPGHAVRWITNGVIGDAGTASSGLLTTLGVTANGPGAICVNSGPITSAYNQLCLGATTNGGSRISSYAYGGATTPGITFDINGTLQSFLTVQGAVAADQYACFADTAGNVKNCGAAPGVTSFNGKVGAVVTPTSNNDLYVSTSGSDSNNGFSPESAKLTIQAAINAASANGTVYVTSGTYTLSAAIGMRSYITLECSPGVTITQANAANLDALVDFSGYIAGSTATGATIRGCWIDGNRANNTGTLTSGVDKRLIYFGNTNDVTIDGNTLVNGPGYGIAGASQTNLVVKNNVINTTELHSFFAVQVTANFPSYCKIMNNRMVYMLLLGLDGCIITGNQLVGELYGNTSDPLRVTISGTAVTWVSGPTFAAVKSGMLLIANNGAVQKSIKTVNSSTSLTLDGSGGSLTNNLAMIGTEDLLGVGAAHQTIIADNYVKGGASFGVSLFGNSASKFDGNVVANNIMDRQGKNGFSLLGDDVPTSGGLGASNNIIKGNLVINSNFGGLAGCSAGIGCLHSYSILAGTMSNIVLDSNHAQDDGALTYSWLNVSGLAAGAIRTGNNNQTGAQNAGISGGISSITLGSGWGDTATTDLIFSFGNAVKFRVTAGGSGIGANPSITVNTVATKMSQGGFNTWNCKMTAGSGTIATLFNEQASTPSAIAIIYTGTPVNALTYEIQCA